jgi:hypothetical protein
MSGMLNLKRGGFYKIKCAQGGEYVGQAGSKTIHWDTCHSYLFAWPNTRDKGCHNPIGIYLWDYGWANRGSYYSFSFNAIMECRELTNKEKEEVTAQFQRLGQHMIKTGP